MEADPPAYKEPVTMVKLLSAEGTKLVSAAELVGKTVSAAELEAYTFVVEQGEAIQSELVKQMIGDNDDVVVLDGVHTVVEAAPLINVKKAILSKVVDYMRYHKDITAEQIQKPLKSTNLKECGVSDWDADFVSMPQETLFELILAANYLDIKPLLDLTCAQVASMIKGKTTEEIRKQFNIVNDFTPEEEAQVREENRWCEDKVDDKTVVAPAH